MIKTRVYFIAAPPRILTLKPPEAYFHWYIIYRVLGVPTPNVTWLMNGHPLDLNKSTIVFDQQSLDNGGGVLDGCLVFTTATHVHNGYYTLIATNEYGTANRTIEANFIAKPGGLAQLLTRPIIYIRRA